MQHPLSAVPTGKPQPEKPTTEPEDGVEAPQPSDEDAVVPTSSTSRDVAKTGRGMLVQPLSIYPWTPIPIGVHDLP